MSLQQTSDDEFIDLRLRSLVYRNPHIDDYLRERNFSDKVNHYEESIPYSKDKRRKDENALRILNMKRFGNILSYNQTDTEDEINYSKYYHSRISQNSSFTRKIYSFHLANDVYHACQVMIKYQNNSLSSSENDQIIIKQKQNYFQSRNIVYKGYLKNNDIFLFKSQHLLEYPFDVKFYINGYIHGYFLTCCEYKYREGGLSFGKKFFIQQIDKSIPCQKCRRHQQKEISSNHQSKQLEEPTINSTNHQQIQDNQTMNEKQLEEENKFRQTLIEQRTSNHGNLFQSLLSLLRNDLHPMEIGEPLPSRYQGNVENFVLILYGINDNEIDFIQSIINFIKIINNIEELNQFVNTLKYEKIILILNDLLIKTIENFEKFYLIYILSNNKNIQIKESSNNQRIFSNIKLIIEDIQNEVILFENYFILFQTSSLNEKENKKFSYSQLLKEIILTKDNQTNLKKDFLDFSRFHYSNNQYQFNLIDQFEQNFTLNQSIHWFKKDSFIKKILSRALFTEEIDILFKMRFIIQSINQQINENNLFKIIYKIHYLYLNQLEQIEKYQNGFISFGTFINCSLNKPNFIENYNQMEKILFQIKTNNAFQYQYNNHIEILLPFDNVYQIESIEKIIIHNYSIIHLISIDKYRNQQYQQLTNNIRNDIQGPVILIQLGKLLLSNNDYLHADYLARLLFNENSFKDNPTLLASLAAFHHLIGSYHNRLNNYHAARLQFQQSLNIFLTFMSEDNQILSATYNNIGSMFYQEDQHEQAIIYHQKALQCQLKSSLPDIDAIATYSGNIGAVYLDQGNYQQALIHYKRSLQILQQSIPDGESLSIALVYDRIASVYWRMDKPNQALPYYQKALQLELKYLPENDHKISVSYFNLSTAYAKLNRLDDAIYAAEKSLQQLLKSVPSDHPEVKENTEQLEGLRRRKWLQQLYQ